MSCQGCRPTRCGAPALSDAGEDRAPAGETIRDIVDDLRTIARYLKTTDVPLEPADDDLRALTAQPNHRDGHRQGEAASLPLPAGTG